MGEVQVSVTMQKREIIKIINFFNRLSSHLFLPFKDCRESKHL